MRRQYAFWSFLARNVFPTTILCERNTSLFLAHDDSKHDPVGFLVYIIDTNFAAVGEGLGDKVLPSPGYILRDVETTIATVEEPSNEPDIAGNKLSLRDQCTITCNQIEIPVTLTQCPKITQGQRRHVKDSDSRLHL